MCGPGCCESVLSQMYLYYVDDLWRMCGDFVGGRVSDRAKAGLIFGFGL